jgi:hypothetical protein
MKGLQKYDKLHLHKRIHTLDVFCCRVPFKEAQRLFCKQDDKKCPICMRV